MCSSQGPLERQLIPGLFVSGPRSEGVTGSGHTHLSGTVSSIMLAHDLGHKNNARSVNGHSSANTLSCLHQQQRDFLFPKHLRMCGRVHIWMGAHVCTCRQRPEVSSAVLSQLSLTLLFNSH